MKLRTGLNPYGLTYYLGMQGRGTPRANPTGGAGLEGFIKLTEEARGKVIELSDGWLKELDEAGLAALRARLEKGDITPVISSGLQHGDVDACIRYAKALGATYMRF